MATRGGNDVTGLELPDVTADLILYPQCCLSLSQAVLQDIANQLPQDGSLVLSVGSGSGLLESLLQNAYPELDIEGVEVAHSINRFLPEKRINIVKGSWSVCHRAADATVLLFVYPRIPQLLSRYINAFRSSLRALLWLGPVADWPEYQSVFSQGGCDFMPISSSLAAFEMLVIARIPKDSL
ncbi:hypothetical protein BX600DRAFT_223350 [Xylariales sp. PMI_506]|nr:hypothetical protein BX600DRAFT_223350 [Xylariales sp. PMI_506]